MHIPQYKRWKERRNKREPVHGILDLFYLTIINEFLGTVREHFLYEISKAFSFVPVIRKLICDRCTVRFCNFQWEISIRMWPAAVFGIRNHHADLYGFRSTKPPLKFIWSDQSCGLSKHNRHSLKQSLWSNKPTKFSYRIMFRIIAISGDRNLSNAIKLNIFLGWIRTGNK